MTPKKRGQGIVKVSDLFKKYTETLRAPQGSIVTAFIDAVRETVGITLKREQCTYKVASRTMVVTASGMLKTELTFKKQLVLACMRERLGDKSAPKDIL